MSLVQGEGRVEILYGVSPMPIPPDRDVYVARPDFSGAHPAVIVVPGDGGVTPSVRALCRRIARFGYAALAPDLFRGASPGPISALPAARLEADLGDLLSVTGDEWSDWCASDRFVTVGLGAGAAAGARLGSGDGGAVVIVPASLHGLAEALASGSALLALVGGAFAGEVHVVRDAVGRGEWVVYGSVGSGFMDDGSGDYDVASAEDAFRRLVAFLDGRLTRIGA
ncbi:MAG: dienelactone hydrolase family protein [Actinomycetota bacterium]